MRTLTPVMNEGTIALLNIYTYIYTYIKPREIEAEAEV